MVVIVTRDLNIQMFCFIDAIKNEEFLILKTYVSAIQYLKNKTLFNMSCISDGLHLE